MNDGCHVNCIYWYVVGEIIQMTKQPFVILLPFQPIYYLPLSSFFFKYLKFQNQNKERQKPLEHQHARPSPTALSAKKTWKATVPQTAKRILNSRNSAEMTCNKEILLLFLLQNEYHFVLAFFHFLSTLFHLCMLHNAVKLNKDASHIYYCNIKHTLSLSFSILPFPVDIISLMHAA